MESDRRDRIIIKGRIDHIAYQNEENGYTVLYLECDDEMITAVGTMPPLTEGERISVSGSFVLNPRYGRQLQVENVECEMPHSLDDIFSYLASGDIKGVGPKRAEKIVKAFGENSLDVIENHPDALSKISGISEPRALQISENYKERFGVREIILKFKKYGMTNAQAIKIYKILGTKAISKVEKNPYILCDECGMSFEFSDEFAKTVGDFSSEDRIVAGVKYILNHNANSNGHTCLPREKLIPLVSRFLEYSSDEVDIHLDLAINRGLIISEEFDKQEYIFLKGYFNSEKRSANSLLSRLTLSSYITDIDLTKEIKQLEDKEKIKYNSLQREAIESAVKRGMLVLTGGPGTGKTTTLKAIINILQSQDEKIVLCAPTGKAAKRMEEVCGHTACTLHRLLEAKIEKGITYFNKDKNNKINCDTVIIDEMSMVDIKLFSALLEALPLSSRIIMVGDSNQLPSVGAGAVLADIISSGKVPTVELNGIFRQAEKSLIVTNAHKIINGEEPELEIHDGDFFFLPTRNRQETVTLITSLYCERLPKSYGSDKKEIQILCPSRMSEEGSVNINQIIQNKINPKTDGEEIKMPPFVLRKGDRVMQIKNDYDIIYRDVNGKEGIGIFNGEVGIIEGISSSQGIASINFDSKLANYSFEELKNIELAYATTIHKSQGSEYDCVIIPIFDVHDKLCYRNLLYTGVTRAKARLILVGSRATLLKMVENDRKTLRYTALEKFMI